MIFGKKEEIDKLKKEIESLKKEIEEERKKSKEYLAGWQRIKADYLNREREIEKERSEWIEFANLEFILKILPIYENLNKSLEHKVDPSISFEAGNENFIKGLEQIKKQFDEVLKILGVEKIKTIGEKFNPEFHEVVEKKSLSSEALAKKESGEGIIIEEVSPGYLMNNRVIKVAKVVIK